MRSAIFSVIVYCQTFHFSSGKYGIRGCILRQIKGFFFKKFSSRSNLWDNCHKIMKISLSLMVSMILGDAFYAKVKGVAPKIFLGASPPHPLTPLPPTLFTLATPLPAMNQNHLTKSSQPVQAGWPASYKQVLRLNSNLQTCITKLTMDMTGWKRRIRL